MTWRTHDLSQIIEHIPIGVAVTLPSGAIEYVNPRLSAMLRSPPAQLEGVDLGDLRISGSSSQNERMRRRLLAWEPWREEAQFVTASGDKLPVLESAYPLRDKEGRVTHFIHFLQDPSLVEISEPAMSTMCYDKMTGLPNRNLCHNRLSLAMGTARRTRHGFAVLSADIDHFKLVNDSLGHDAGDDLLRQVAARMRACLRDTDTVARLGGDEFGAILDRVLDSEISANIAVKLLEAHCAFLPAARPIDEDRLGGRVGQRARAPAPGPQHGHRLGPRNWITGARIDDMRVALAVDLVVAPVGA